MFNVRTGGDHHTHRSDDYVQLASEIRYNCLEVCRASVGNFLSEINSFSIIMKIEGSVALVTGGATGIGRMIIEGLLEKGLKGVVIVDINVEKSEQTVKDLNEKFGAGKVAFSKADVSNEDELEDSFKKVFDLYGQLDIVANNAGIADETNFKRMYEVNVFGVIHGTYLALKYMGKCNGGKGGVIINTASIQGLRPFWTSSTYSGTKFAVVGFSRSVAMLDESIVNTGYAVRINCLCPGYTPSDLKPKYITEEFTQKALPWLEDIAKNYPCKTEWLQHAFNRMVEDDSLNGACIMVRCTDGETLHYPGDQISFEL